MEIKKIEKSDLVLFPRLQEQGVPPSAGQAPCGCKHPVCR